MLDWQKLIVQLHQLDQEIFGATDRELKLVQKHWDSIKNDENLAILIRSKKWSLLVPAWQELLGQTFDIKPQPHPYQVLAVDGSQIYYDRHQGPACYLINVGAVFFSYGLVQSSVQFHSTPSVIIADQTDQQISAEAVNLAREQAELSWAVNQASQIRATTNQLPFVVMFDGTLIFFQAEGQNEQKEQIFESYMNHLQALHDQKILHVGYVSFPKSKELVNILKLSVAEFDEKKLKSLTNLYRLNDMDIAQIFLKFGQRSIVFESKAPICYLYPKNLKPHFCYLHVGSEIARLEFPAWIVQDSNLVDLICAVALDQAIKGRGYPVCLFEAHEQAVVKAPDREFFYLMIQKMVHEQAGVYQISKKSQKKASVPV